MFFLSKFRKTLNSICIGIDYDDNYEEQYQLLPDVTNSDMEEDSDQTVDFATGPNFNSMKEELLFRQRMAAGFRMNNKILNEAN